VNQGFPQRDSYQGYQGAEDSSPKSSHRLLLIPKAQGERFGSVRDREGEKAPEVFLLLESGHNFMLESLVEFRAATGLYLDDQSSRDHPALL
jgi:hypothetical protein